MIKNEIFDTQDALLILTQYLVPHQVLNSFKLACDFDYVFDATEVEGELGEYEFSARLTKLDTHEYKIVRKTNSIEVGIQITEKEPHFLTPQDYKCYTQIGSFRQSYDPEQRIKFSKQTGYGVSYMIDGYTKKLSEISEGNYDTKLKDEFRKVQLDDSQDISEHSAHFQYTVSINNENQVACWIHCDQRRYLSRQKTFMQQIVAYSQFQDISICQSNGEDERQLLI